MDPLWLGAAGGPPSGPPAAAVPCVSAARPTRAVPCATDVYTQKGNVLVLAYIHRLGGSCDAHMHSGWDATAFVHLQLVSEAGCAYPKWVDHMCIPRCVHPIWCLRVRNGVCAGAHVYTQKGNVLVLAYIHRLGGSCDVHMHSRSCLCATKRRQDIRVG